MTNIRPITKLMIAGDPAKADEITVDCTRETSVHDLSDQVLEYMREIAEACSTADHKVCVYTFSVKS